MNRTTYLSERHYEKPYLKNYNTEKVECWKKILDDTSFDNLLQNNIRFEGYLKDEDFYAFHIKKIDGLMEYLETNDLNKHKLLITDDSEEKIYFSPFYTLPSAYGLDLLRTLLKCNSYYFDIGIYSNFSLHLTMLLQRICIRTLIVEMQSYKQKGLLIGQDERKQYHYYDEHIVDSKAFVRKVFTQYPVMYRCIWEKAEQLAHFYSDVIRYFEKDLEQIQQWFKGGKRPRKVIGITVGV